MVPENCKRWAGWQLFALPLDRERFRAALASGQGRALLHARRYGIDDRLDDVVDACLHNRAYDPQCEGERATWMVWLAELAGAMEPVAEPCLARVNEPPTGKNRHWHVAQRCRLMLLLARRGYRTARDHLYRIASQPESSMDLTGAEEIIELDGAAGLFWIAELLGSRLIETPDQCVDDWPIYYYDKQHGRGAARAALEPLSDDPMVARYLHEVLAERTRLKQAKAAGGRSRAERLPQSADDVIGWVEHADVDLDAPVPPGLRLASWGRRASESDLSTIAARLEQAPSSPGKLYLYLQVFRDRSMPAPPEATPDTSSGAPEPPRPLLRAADHPHWRVRELAYTVLGHFRHLAVRELALERLQPTELLNGSLLLFRVSYQSGDCDNIARSLIIPDDPDALHGMIFDVKRLITEQRRVEMLDLMLFAYEHSPCARCRADIVEVMQETGTTPPLVREEAAFDVSATTREKVRSETDGEH